jgi:hypothetical protein
LAIAGGNTLKLSDLVATGAVRRVCRENGEGVAVGFSELWVGVREASGKAVVARDGVDRKWRRHRG